MTSKPLACLLEPGEVALVVGGVGDGQEAVLQPVGEEVVEHAAVLAAQHAVLRAALAPASRRRWRASAAGTPRPPAPWSRSRPCARRRTRRRARAPPRAPGGCPRTAPASPSPRTARAAHRPPHGGRTAGCASGSRLPWPSGRWTLAPAPAGTSLPRKSERRGHAGAGKRLGWQLAAAFFALPAAAHAGTYDVVSCNAPGAGGVNRVVGADRTPRSTGRRARRCTTSTTTARAPAGGLVANSHNGNAEYGNAPPLTGGVWLFTAPAGTMITHATVWRHALKYRTAEDARRRRRRGRYVGHRRPAGERQHRSAARPARTARRAAGTGASASTAPTASTRAARPTTTCRRSRSRGAPTCKLVPERLPALLRRLDVEHEAHRRARDPHRQQRAVATVARDETAGAARARRSPTTPPTTSASAPRGSRRRKLASSNDRSCDYTLAVPCSNVKGGSLTLPAGRRATAATRCASPPRTRPATRGASRAR